LNNDFGYLIVISKSTAHRYDLMAILLAQSIKHTQKSGYDKVAVVTDDKEKLSWLRGMPYFDQVIFWNNKNYWDGRSWMDELSPWKYTVCLDADMIFFRDTSHWVDYFIQHSYLYVANTVLQYNGDILNDTFCRNTFIVNKLPSLYSAYTFFNKSDKSKEFFDLSRQILLNPIEFKNYFLSKHIPKVIGTDETFALAAKILDIDKDIAYPLAFPRFTHLKSILQSGLNGGSIPLELGYYFNDSNFKIGVFNQTELLHYADKDLDVGTLIELYQKKFMKLIKAHNE